MGQNRFRQVVDTNFWRSLTTVFLKDANFVDTARLMSDIRAYEREHLAPKGIKLGFAGDVALSQSLIHGIVTTQLQSLCWSLAGIYLVTALAWRLVALGILLRAAERAGGGDQICGHGLAWDSAGRGDLDVRRYDPRHRGELRDPIAGSLWPGARRRSAAAEALSRAMALTGPPALINTLAVSLGFGVLMLSQVPANARLGHCWWCWAW